MDNKDNNLSISMENYKGTRAYSGFENNNLSKGFSEEPDEVEGKEPTPKDVHKNEMEQNALKKAEAAKNDKKHTYKTLSDEEKRAMKILCNIENKTAREKIEDVMDHLGVSKMGAINILADATKEVAAGKAKTEGEGAKAEPKEENKSLEKGEEDEIDEEEGEDVEKGGEGSRGGRIVGRTKSGRPIYATQNARHESKFSGQDHTDAAYAHLDHATKLKKEGKHDEAKRHSEYFDKHMATAAHKKRNEELDKVKKSEGNSLEKAIDRLDDYLEKAKYTKRTGTPGNYKYEYADDKKGNSKSGGENVFSDFQTSELMRMSALGHKDPQLTAEIAKRGLESAAKRKGKVNNTQTDAQNNGEKVKIGPDSGGEKGTFSTGGSTYNTTMFRSKDAANKFMSENKGHGVIGEYGNIIHVAKNSDKGTPNPKPAKTQNAELENITNAMNRLEEQIQREQKYINDHGEFNDSGEYDHQWEEYKRDAQFNLDKWDDLKKERDAIKAKYNLNKSIDDDNDLEKGAGHESLKKKFKKED